MITNILLITGVAVIMIIVALIALKGYFISMKATSEREKLQRSAIKKNTPDDTPPSRARKE